MNIDENVVKFIKSSRCSVYTSELSESEETRLRVLFNDCLSAIINQYVEEFIAAKWSKDSLRNFENFQ